MAAYIALGVTADLVGLQYFATNLGNSVSTLFLKTDASGSLTGSTFNNGRYQIGRDCVLAGLRVEFTAAAGAGANVTYTVQVDGVDTGIVVTILNGATFGTSDVQVSVLRDQAVAIKSVASAADTTAINVRAVIPLRIPA